jgi:hypothetical protein
MKITKAFFLSRFKRKREVPQYQAVTDEVFYSGSRVGVTYGSQDPKAIKKAPRSYS